MRKYETSLNTGASCAPAFNPIGDVVGHNVVSTVGDTIVAVRLLSERVQAMVDDLAGAVPRPGSLEKVNPEKSGVLPQLAESAESASYAIRAAHEALDRLKAVIG